MIICHPFCRFSPIVAVFITWVSNFCASVRHASGDQAAGLNLTSAYQTVVVNTASMARATTTLLRWRGSSRRRGRGWRGRSARPRAWCPRRRPPPPPGLTPGTSPSSRSSQSSLTSGTKQQVGDFYCTSLIFRWVAQQLWFWYFVHCRNIKIPKNIYYSLTIWQVIGYSLLKFNFQLWILNHIYHLFCYSWYYSSMYTSNFDLEIAIYEILHPQHINKLIVI